MPPRFSARAAAALTLALLLPLPAGVSAQAQQSGVARTLIAQAEDLRKEKKEAEALETSDRALAAAQQMNDRAAEAEAARLSGRILYTAGRYAESQKRYEVARAATVATKDRLGEAQVFQGLGNAAWGLGNRAEARSNYEQAIAIYRELKMTRDALAATHGLTLVLDDPDVENRVLSAAIDEAVAAKETEMEGRLRQDLGDLAFNRGLYADAFAQLQKARQLAELDTDDRRQLALVLTSIGRLYRAHGEPEQATELYRGALAIQEQADDVYGQVQSLNAIASTLQRLGRSEEALPLYDRAIKLTDRLESPRVTRYLMGGRASALSAIGQHAEALPVLLASLEGEEDGFVRAIRRRSIAQTYLMLGEPKLGLEQINKEIDTSASARYADELPRALTVRAQIREQLGDIDGALDDARQASALLEEMRRNLVPSDYMKRGFAEWNENVYGVNIAIATRRGDANGAFMAAEQARARALLDLLALRTEIRRARGAADGGAAAAAAPRAAGLGKADLASPLAAGPPSMERLAATAARLRSTILSYWVGDDATFLWVMTPEGTVRLRRITAGRQQLEALVAQTLPASATQSQKVSATTVASRGQALELPAAPLQALRRLHALLIEPAEEMLPTSGRLTVIPHGPLFKLSFAALKDKRGKYLIERYAIHYAPSVAALELTTQTGRPQRSGYLLVSNPAPLPSVLDPIDGRPRPLPPLPGSVREARAIAALLPANETTLLDGPRATEAQVKAALHGKRVLHLATHGIIRDSEPLASFIAVGETGRGAAADGRLTVEELYDFDLDSDLVVLSACRSADGPVSGDGVFGLTRALLSAGTPSVIASAWEVADEPTAQLMPEFYRQWLRSGSKVESLRQAQLLLIRDLRAGRVRVQTPIGRITLAEHPLFWAGFMLIGDPQ